VVARALTVGENTLQIAKCIPRAYFTFAHRTSAGRITNVPHDHTPSRFADLFHAADHRQSLCVLAVLAWIASCDGRIAPREREMLRGVAEANDAASELAALLDAMAQADPADLELACRFLRNHTDRAGKRLLAQLAVTMAVQDGHLSVGENYVLQFLADLLGLSARTFGKLFEEVAHRPFPLAGDPSSVDWWRRREAGQQARAEAPSEPRDETAGDDGRMSDGPMTRGIALRMLGLEDGASQDAIHAAYRRLAKSRHPDRFAPLGPAAVATASEAFKRLHEAYAILSA